MKRHFLNLIGVVAAMAVIFPQAARGAETARSEWMRGYIKMENGDRNVTGNPTEALGQYREALEIFERVRRKYPTWNESLLNYRIKYCKEQIEKLGKNVGQKSTDMRRDDLVKLTKDQYTTITKLNDERKSLQSRVEVLTESLEKARAVDLRRRLDAAEHEVVLDLERQLVRVLLLDLADAALRLEVVDGLWEDVLGLRRGGRGLCQGRRDGQGRRENQKYRDSSYHDDSQGKRWDMRGGQGNLIRFDGMPQQYCHDGKIG